MTLGGWIASVSIRTILNECYSELYFKAMPEKKFYGPVGAGAAGRRMLEKDARTE
ncbi:MAG TPA: hypothetical protein VN617_01755 [Rhodoferax sp.]|nr:hypothetical protein [Rhodoferax sp.]